jgi:cyclopropane fatty-acyl-phospholipid synthase-like methyltransferase
LDRLGPEDYQSNRHIRKLLKLARATERDVFYDLGCGRGQLCVVAVSEFGVRRAVGIEMHAGRAAKAAAHVEKLGLSDRIEIRNEDFMDSDIHDATVVYCGTYEMEEDVEHFGNALGAGSRFVTLFLPFVAVLPTASDYPFYSMEVPFRKTTDIRLWTSKVLFRDATLEELCEELDTDREYRYDKRTFRRLVRERFVGAPGLS